MNLKKDALPTLLLSSIYQQDQASLRKVEIPSGFVAYRRKTLPDLSITGDEVVKETVIVCHRGACLSAPENTFASLAGAIELGADVVEFDIRTSRDDVLYVIHDETVDRTTDGSGRVADMTSAQIDRLDAGSWFGGNFVGERVPRLTGFLDGCIGKIGIYAEIKQADPARVRDMLAERGLLADAWTFSFDPSIRAETRANVPDFRRMVLFEHVGSVERAIALDAHILEFHPENLSAERVSACKEAGMLTQMYYDGNDSTVFAKALHCGVEQMNLNEVELFREVEAEMRATVI